MTYARSHIMEPEQVRQLLEYDSDTGLFRRIDPQTRGQKGWYAGVENGKG